MSKLKGADLDLAAELDLAVAKALGKKGYIDNSIFTSKHHKECKIEIKIFSPSVGGPNYLERFMVFNPSTNWSQGGPLIEEYKIQLTYYDALEENLRWVAVPYSNYNAHSTGPTPLIAAMRALVKTKEQEK